MVQLDVLDLFSGAGGFALGLERAGMKTIAFCESNKVLRSRLMQHWPNVELYHDVTRTDEIVQGVADRISVIVGGDPCPIRSQARRYGECQHPDLSGYFLALVGRLRPRWVVRENVPAPDDSHFTACLELLGYRTSVIRTDAASFTSQQRKRDFVVGADKSARACLAEFVRQFRIHPVDAATHHKKRPVIPCLTTRRNRYSPSDCYIWEESGLRVPDRDERTAFAGFPPGWFDGLSEAALARACGNAAVPAVVEKIGRAIVTAELVTE
jgi:site-specific DNA-cytosine methylase